MCTFNIAINDRLVSSARSSFPDDKSLTKWMEEQITVLLTSTVAETKEKAIRRPRKHDALMGIIGDIPEVDYKRVHLQEKYGI